MKVWGKALDDLLALKADQIVPGYSPISGTKDVKAMKTYLAAFDCNAKKLCATSSDVEQITNEMIKVLPPRADGAFIVKANIQVRYVKPADKQ